VSTRKYAKVAHFVQKVKTGTTPIHPRTQAAAEGRVRYSDGVPCIHGHVAERYTRSAHCCECLRLHGLADKRRIRNLMAGAR
jgi:hypothetical protein